LEQLLRAIFEKDLGLETRNMNVLMTESPFASKEDKCKLTQLMFETFKVQSFSLINTAVLSLFSTGKTCGLVAECGEGLTYTVPIFEGYALPHAMQCSKVAGQDITASLMRELIAGGVEITNDHLDLVRQMKEQMCHISLDYNSAYYSRDDVLDQE